MTIQEIVRLARTEADKHGFTQVPIRIDNSKNRLGGMAHRGAEVLYLTFSSVLLPLCSDDVILDTIRHEIAHAKTPLAGHGYEWRVAAREIGARPKPCASVDIDPKAAGFKYIAGCACGPNRYGKSRRPTRYFRCRNCKERLNYVQQY